MRIYFSNTPTNLVTDYKLKQYLIDFLYKNVSIGKLKYKLLTADNLKHLSQNKHSIILNSCDVMKWRFANNGNKVNSFSGRCLLIFTHIDGKNRSFIIDRRTLQYDRNHVKIDRVKIIEPRFNIVNMIYNNSVMDCNLMRNQKLVYCRVNDIYMWSGKQMLNIKLEDKLNKFKAIIDNPKHYKKNDKIDVCILKVAKLYEYSDLRMLRKLIPQNNPTYLVDPEDKICYNGLSFVPEYSSLWYLYLLSKHQTNEDEDDMLFLSKSSKNHLHIKKWNDKVHNLKPKKIVTFMITPTNRVQIYDLFMFDRKDDLVRIGEARIKTLNDVNMVKSLFEFTSEAIVDCKYDVKTKKWCPIKRSDKS